MMGQALVKVGPDILRGAAVGFACGTVPAACPAILAMNQSATVARAIVKVYSAYTQASSPEEGLHDAGKEVSRQVVATTLNQVAQHQSREEISAVSQTIGRAMGTSVGVAFGTGSGTVEILAAETTRHALEEGISGLLSWGVDKSVR